MARPGNLQNNADMSLGKGCFENVIGLSRTDCECFGTAPAGFDFSASGLYLDETPGLNLKKLFAAAECADEGWTLMQRFRENGQRRFTMEVLKYVEANAKRKRKDGRSQVGSTERGEKTLMMGNTLHGLDVMTAHVVGGTMTVHRIGMYVKFNGSVNVSVYGIDDDDPIEVVTVVAEQNKLVWTELDTPLVLSLDTPSSENPRYWFLWEPAGRQSLSSKVASCGCSGKPKFDVRSKHFESAVVMDGKAWTQWVMAGGTKGNDLSNRRSWQHTNETQGLLLDVSLKCDGRSSICAGAPDYESDPIQASFAHGVQYAAALEAIEYITKSTRVRREAITDGDELELMRVNLRKEIDLRAEWIGVELSDEENVNRYSDCYACKDPHGIQVSTMRR